MKVHFYKIIVSSIFLFFSSVNTFAQSPGDLFVENQTDCNISVFCYYYPHVSVCSNIVCTPENFVAGQTVAYANSTTKVHDGSGLSGTWGKTEMVSTHN